MQPDYTLAIAGYVAGALSSLFFLSIVFKYRTASRWVPFVLTILGFISILLGTRGVPRLGYSAHFTRQTRFLFYDTEALRA